MGSFLDEAGKGPFLLQFGGSMLSKEGRSRKSASAASWVIKFGVEIILEVSDLHDFFKFLVVFVFSLRFMFEMNVLQPKFIVNTRN